ncbi:MAG: hypothetical protein OJF49_001835 [Ktedonobacterales bacterium]|jgi:photosystem II stability/assembly factor-like uncharacterized protein|nr:MAG: hypothetical protein OJF49_001835 [Ktedonobacterales bacterium]
MDHRRRGTAHRIPGTYFASIALALLALLLAACGGTTTGTGGGLNITKGTPMTTPRKTATPAPPTPVPPPYTFPYSWQPATVGAGTLANLAFAPSDPRTGYLCTVQSPAGGGGPLLYRTSDGGQNWTSLPLPNTSTAAYPTCSLFIDPLNASDVFYATSGLWRSQNGGASWSALTQPSVQGYPSLTLILLTVTQGRIVVEMGINGEGRLPNPLFASDDGGKTWKNIPQNLSSNGQKLLSGDLVGTMGATLVIYAMAPSSGGSGNYVPPAMPGGSQQPSGAYFTSTDGGATWNLLSVPDPTATILAFAPSADGTTYNILLTVLRRIQGASVAVPYFSKDGGQTWQQLPTLQGMAGGFPDPGSLGRLGAGIAPDSSILADARHTYAEEDSDAGIFQLNPADAAPAWRAVALSSIGTSGATGWQITPGPSGTRMWTIAFAQGQSGGTLGYLDLP